MMRQEKSILSGVTRPRGNNMSAHTLGELNKLRVNSGDTRAQHQNSTMLFNSVHGAFVNQSSCFDDEPHQKHPAVNTGGKSINNLTTMPNTQNNFYSQFDPFVTGTNFTTLMAPNA